MSDAAPPRVALVVQRYGDEVVGGAESLACRLALVSPGPPGLPGRIC